MPSKDVIISLAAVIITAIVFTLVCTVNVWKPVYSAKAKEPVKVVKSPAYASYSGEIMEIHGVSWSSKPTVRPCDPAKDWPRCGAVLWRNGKEERPE